MHREQAPPLTQAISVVWAERCPSSSFRLLFLSQCSVSCLLAFTPTFQLQNTPLLWSVPPCWSAQYRVHFLQNMSCVPVPARSRVMSHSVTTHSWELPTACFVCCVLHCEKLPDCGSHIEPSMGWKIREHARSVRLTFLQGFRADMEWQAN